MTHRYRRSLAVMLTVLVACGRHTEPLSEPEIIPPEKATMSLEVPPLSDTIGVVVNNPIVILVRKGASMVAAAADIRVTVSTPPGAIPLAGVGVASAGPFTHTVASQTNAAGELRVFVSLGNVAGQGTIVVEAPSLALRDSARFTVSPGRLAKWTIIPRDTAVFTANTLKIRYELFDRGGNTTLETPQVVSATGVSAASTSGVFSADPTVQRGRIILRTSLRTDTVQVSVVPRDTLVFVWHDDRSYRLAAVGLDGTIVRTYGEPLVSGFYMPALSPDGLRVVSNEGQGLGEPITTAHLFISDTTPLPRQAVGGSVPIPKLRYNGVFFRSGDWILFQSRTRDDSSSVWRIRTDGSGEMDEILRTDFHSFVFDAYPFPDNRSVAIAVGSGGTGGIYRYDVQTHQPIFPGIASTSYLPSIAVSPTGDRVAWTEFTYDLFVVNTDGTGKRRLAAGVSIARPVWTRDGRFLVFDGGAGVSSSLIDVATGAVIPLPWNRATGKGLPFLEAGSRP